MIKNTLIIALILVAIYLYYQNRKLKGLPHSASSDNSTPLTVFNLDENQEELIAEKDAAIRSKNEAEQEVLSLSNKLRNKHQEVSRKDQEITRIKDEKSQVEISLNNKIKEVKKELEEVKKKYSERERLLDEEQTDNNKLTEKIEQLEQQITELNQERTKNIPGSWEETADKEAELEQKHQEQLRAINLLFDEQAKDYPQIDFNGLYSLLENIAEEQKKKKKTSRGTASDIQSSEKAKKIKK